MAPKANGSVFATVFVPENSRELSQRCLLDNTLSHPGESPSLILGEVNGCIELSNEHWVIVAPKLHNGNQANVGANLKSFTKVVRFPTFNKVEIPVFTMLVPGSIASIHS